MNIDGMNTLACTKGYDEVKGAVKVYPLPHLAVVKDLVPDITKSYADHALLEPWLETVTPSPPRRSGCRARERPSKSSTACGNASSLLLLHRLPELLVERAITISARPPFSRPIAGRSPAATRRPATPSTTWRIFGLYRCHTIMNCPRTCPKGLNLPLILNHIYIARLDYTFSGK